LFTILSINAVWDREIVCVEQSRKKVIPSVNLAGPSSEISHLDFRRAAKQSFLAAKEAMEKMLLTCTLKMIVPVGERQMYTHHSQLSCTKFHPRTALLKVLFQTQLACFIP